MLWLPFWTLVKEGVDKTPFWNPPLSGPLNFFIGKKKLGYRGRVASWSVRSTPVQLVRIRSLAGDIVLCSWARHFTLTVPLSIQVYKWVPANLMLDLTL